MKIIQSSSRATTTVWQHHFDFVEKFGEKARWELHKNTTSRFQQILEAALENQQLFGHLTLISYTI